MAQGSSAYAEKLKDPRWQKRRLEILARDDFACQHCLSKTKTLHVHHRWYTREAEGPWDYPDIALVTLCEDCHGEETFLWRVAADRLISALRRAGVSAPGLAVMAESIASVGPLSDNDSSALAHLVATAVLHETPSLPAEVAS